MRLTISIDQDQHIQLHSALSASYTGTSGIYSSVELSASSAESVKKLCSNSGIKYLDKGLHCTVIYCKEESPASNLAMNFSSESYNADAIKIDWWEGHDKQGYLVLQLESKGLSVEHKRFVEAGCTETFDEYKPHITLAHPYAIDTKEKEYQIKLANMSLRKRPLTINFINQKIEDLRED